MTTDKKVLVVGDGSTIVEVRKFIAALAPDISQPMEVLKPTEEHPYACIVFTATKLPTALETDDYTELVLKASGIDAPVQMEIIVEQQTTVKFDHALRKLITTHSSRDDSYRIALPVPDTATAALIVAMLTNTFHLIDEEVGVQRPPEIQPVVNPGYVKRFHPLFSCAVPERTTIGEVMVQLNLAVQSAFHPVAGDGYSYEYFLSEDSAHISSPAQHNGALSYLMAGTNLLNDLPVIIQDCLKSELFDSGVSRLVPIDGDPTNPDLHHWGLGVDQLEFVARNSINAGHQTVMQFVGDATFYITYDTYFKNGKFWVDLYLVEVTPHEATCLNDAGDVVPLTRRSLSTDDGGWIAVAVAEGGESAALAEVTAEEVKEADASEDTKSEAVEVSAGTDGEHHNEPSEVAPDGSEHAGEHVVADDGAVTEDVASEPEAEPAPDTPVPETTDEHAGMVFVEGVGWIAQEEAPAPAASEVIDVTAIAEASPAATPPVDGAGWQLWQSGSTVTIASDAGTAQAINPAAVQFQPHGLQ